MPKLSGVRHRFIDANGLRVHVAEAGRGEPLVLLHGWPQHWYSFHRIIPQLARRFHVIVPDMRGFGWTDAPSGGYRKRELAADTIAVLDALGIDDAVVAGHDWGGMIAWLLAVEHPERVRRLIAMNTGHLWPKAKPEVASSVLRLATYQPLIAAPLTGRLLVRRAMLPLVAKQMRAAGTWSDAAAASYTDQFDDTDRVRASVALYRAFLLHEAGPWLAGRYADRRVTAPTLVIHGDADEVLRPSILRELEHHVDDLRVEIIPGANHFVAEDVPDEVSRLLLEFAAT
ncbi:MAG: Soluble epoxide hydrolase [Thermoleophilia bacterium]|nr:Soluble epoxide hydrolase [Thermoleophilia bacterium]